MQNTEKGCGTVMKNEKLFEKAYSRLLELYSGEYATPDTAVLSRFYHEKKILGNSDLYMRYLHLLGRIREAAHQKGEHVFVRGTAGASFVAYLLGATDINPLPRHEYCPHCRTTTFIGSGTPFDKAPKKCPCGAELKIDGHAIPFASNLKSVLSEQIQIGVSHAFLDEARAMICDEMWDKAIVTLSDNDRSPIWFCFLDPKTNEHGEYALNVNRDLFSAFPRITLVPSKTLDAYRELETATGFKVQDVGTQEESLAFFRFLECDIRGIPHFDHEFVRGIWNTIHPKSYNDLLKMIGFAHSTNVWKDNAEILLDEHRKSLGEIPAYREELYEMICERLRNTNIYDDGLAYEVADKTTRGYYAKNGGVDEHTMLALLEIGFDIDLIGFLSEIHYMFTKAHGVAFLHEAIVMMVYKTKFPQEYAAIMSKKAE